MKIANLNKTIGIPRTELPQIRGKYIPEMLQSLEDAGVRYRRDNVSCKRLKPSQDQLNMDKVEKMIADGKDKEDRDLLVSREGFIVDGHHYWGARCSNNIATVNVIIVDMNIIDLINFLNDQEFTFSKKITENRRNK